MKKIFMLLALLISTQVFASLNSDELLKELAGQWSLKVHSTDVKFLIRSSGDIKIISSAHNSFFNAQITFNNSTSDWGLDGLPVANIIISEGSDEDVRDIHFLVTGLQEGDEVKLKKLATFSTFNDGPNDFSDVDSGYSFKKYDPKTKTWNEVK